MNTSLLITCILLFQVNINLNTAANIKAKNNEVSYEQTEKDIFKSAESHDGHRIIDRNDIHEQEETDTFHSAVNDNGKSTAIALAGQPISGTTLNMLFTVFRTISKVYNFSNQYGFLLPKFLSLVQSGGLSVYNVISTLPYIVLALQRANAPTVPGKDSSMIPAAVLGKFNLASTIEDPQKLKTLLNNEKIGDLAIDSLKVVAGVEASEVFDKLMREVEKSANESNGGVIGMSGEHLNSLLRNSDSLKKLFKTDELTDEGLKYIHAYMDSYLHPEIAKLKNDVFTEMQQIRTNRQSAESNDEHRIIDRNDIHEQEKTDTFHSAEDNRSLIIDSNLKEQMSINSLKNKAYGTLLDAITAFRKVGQRNIYEKLRTFNANADKEVSNWKDENIKNLNDVNNSYISNALSRSQSMILQTTPNAVLKTLASGNLIRKKYDYLFKFITAYFLPKGIAISALKFTCLVTYITLVVQKENLIPDKVGKKEIKIETMGLSTDRIVDVLNNKEMMGKIFPTDHSSVAVDMLKFVAGPQTTVIDNLATELRKIKIQKYGEQSQEKLKITDLLQNVALFKKLYSIKQYTEETKKKYLPEMDLMQIKNEIGEEMKNINNDKGPSENVDTSTFSAKSSEIICNAASATCTVALRKSNDMIGKIGSDIKKEADAMITEYTSPESKNAKGFLGSTIQLTPSPILHTAATAIVARNKIVGLFQRGKKAKDSEQVEETVTGNND